MENINIEKIMQEIRDEITEKGYTNDMLSFNDIILDGSDLTVSKFDKVRFNEELYSLNHFWDVKAYRSVEHGNSIKSKIITFIRKIIRKSIKFYIEPINADQNTFNAVTVKLFNLMECYISENKKNAELQETVEELKKEINELKQSIQKRDN